jgi:hypothetical protein
VLLSVSDLAEKGYVIESDLQKNNGSFKWDFNPKDWLALGGTADEVTSGPASRGAVLQTYFAKDMGSN